MGFENGRIVGVQTFFVNLGTALILALLVALALRWFAILVFARGLGSRRAAFCAVVGVAYLTLACFYALFAEPLIVWDGSTRTLCAVTSVAVPLWTAWRILRTPPEEAARPLRLAFAIPVFLLIALLGAFALLRAGNLALTGDRVTLIIYVSGETGTRSVPPTPKRPGKARPADSAWVKTLTLHHVTVTLPSGVPAGDFWIYGERFAIRGRVLRAPRVLAVLGVPNLYALLDAHSGSVPGGTEPGYPFMLYRFEQTGPLAVHPWWRPAQAEILGRWTMGGGASSLWTFASETNDSPYYPLVDRNGKPVSGRFLLVLPPSGVPTSRGSSPLEPKRRAR